MTLPQAQQLRLAIQQANLPGVKVEEIRFDPDAMEYYLWIRDGGLQCAINNVTEWETFRKVYEEVMA